MILKNSSIKQKRIVLFEKTMFFWGIIPENNNIVVLVRKCKKEDFTNGCNLHLEYYLICQNHNSDIGFVVEKEIVKRYNVSEKEEREYLFGRTIFGKN